MLKLKDKNKNLVAGLINYKDLCIENILATGDKKLSFSLHKEDKFYNLIEEECYIETKEAEFVIKARDVGIDYTRFDCVLNLEELEANIFDRFESVEQTITASLNLAIVGTGWTVNDNTLKKKRTVRCTNKNALEIVQEIKKTYRVDIVFNTLKREIEVYEHLGEDKGTYFIDSLNLTALQVQSDSYKFATRIIAEGKDGLTFSSINNGKNYVENYQYSNKIKTIYWKDERYTVKESLLEDAKAKLEELSKPFTSYNASVLNLAELNPKYKSILDYSLGDTITLLSKSNKVKDKQRIVKTIEWPQDHTKDTVELANATLKFEDIQQENQETTDTVSNITVDNGTVDGSTIDSIQVKQIEDFKANVIEVVNLKAINASIDNLHANKADIQDLHAVTAKIGTLEATKANITQLNATNAEISKLNAIKANITDLNAAVAKISVLESKASTIDNLVSQKADIKDLNALNANISNALIKKANVAELEAMEAKTNKLIANKADISDLNAANANINSIKADTADIKTLINGNLSSENIQTGGITSDKLTISDGFIKDAMIANVSASKLAAGTIDAAKINVVNLNADNLTVGKINGHLLKDGSISGLAIGNGAIDNSKVAPGANIEASKININSVVTAINAGSTLLTANKIAIDSDKGTLDLAFKNLNTSLDANKKATESNSTAINVQQGQINASIENSKILEGKQKTLEDNYNRTASTVDSLKNTIGSHKTLIDSATGKITSVEVKANTLEKNLSGLTQTVTDTKKVIENNKTVLESKNAELKANIDSVSSSLSSVSSTVDKNNKTLVAKTNTLEQNLNGLTQTVESNKTVTDGKITSVESETHELKAGLGGLTSKLDTLKSTTDSINKTVSNQGSVINQLKDSINLKVDSSTFTQSTTTINNNINKAKEEAINTANRNTTNAINSLEIGGRNLVLDSLVNESSSNYEFAVREVKGLEPNTEYIFSANGFIKSNNEKKSLVVYIYPPDWSWSYNFNLPYDNAETRFIKFRTPNEIKKGIVVRACCAPNSQAVDKNLATLNWYKVEKGNKLPTDWTPAPEDLKAYSDDVAKAKADLAQANAIANADGKITEEERKRIQQAQENLNTAIAKATEAETKAKSYADTKKQEAINAASTDATNKANNALNNAKAYTNTEITTVNTHLNKATAEINILKGQIESKVSQSDIDKSIQNIKFNDVNMILNSGEFKDTDHWSCTNGSNNLTIENRILKFKFTNYAAWGCYISNNSLLNKPLDISKKYTVVCKLKASKNQILTFNICDGNSYNYVFGKELSLTTEWQIFKFTFNPTQVGNERQFRFITSNLGYDFDLYIEFVKMVEGATSSDSWSMAPDYVLDNIKTVTDKINTVESTLVQKTNSIEAGVRDLNSTTQTITTNVSNINRDLTSKINSSLDVAKNFATDVATNKANTAKQEAIVGARNIPDTRNDNQSPQWYIEHYPKQLINEFKNANVIGISGTTYGILETKVPWGDSSGGFPVQTFRSNNTPTYQRRGLNSTNWSAWEQIEDTQGSQAKANDALNNAKSYANAQITTVNSKVHNVESNLNILSDRINSKVSQSDIDKAVTTIRTEKIIYARGTGNDFPSNALVKVNGKTITDGQGRGLRINALNKATLERVFLQDYDTFGSEDAKLSFVNKINELNNGDYIIIITSQDASYPLHPPIKEALEKIGATLFDNKQGTYREAYALIGKSKLGRGNGVEMFIPRTANDKRFAEVSVKVGEDGTFIGVNPNNMGLEATLIKSNISDVSSSVTQLRDSVTTDIRAINSKTQSIETTLGSKASKQEVTEVNNRVATIKASLDSITQRVSSTESKTQTLETNLNGKASKQEVNNVSSKVASIETSLNGITQRVSSAESNINKTNDRINSLASKEEVAQLKITTNSISTEVSKKVNSNELISKINQSAETVQINASKINLQGYVTVGELGSSNVTTINNAHITSGTIEGRTMIALNGTGKQNGVLTVNNGESYLEYFRCREAWMMSPYANGWRVPLIHSKFGVKDSETASDMIDEISFYRGTDGRNYLQITNTKTGRVEYIELYRSAFDTVTILNRLDRIDAKLAGL